MDLVLKLFWSPLAYVPGAFPLTQSKSPPRSNASANDRRPSKPHSLGRCSGFQSPGVMGDFMWGRFFA